MTDRIGPAVVIDLTRFVDVAVVAKELGVARQTIDRLVNDGRVLAIILPGGENLKSRRGVDPTAVKYLLDLGRQSKKEKQEGDRLRVLETQMEALLNRAKESPELFPAI